jgi:hypothetical protein
VALVVVSASVFVLPSELHACTKGPIACGEPVQANLADEPNFFEEYATPDFADFVFGDGGGEAVWEFQA